MAGIVSTGFETRLVDEIVDDVGDDMLANISPTLDLNPDGVLGQLIGILSASDASLWDALQAVYSASYVATATGASLDQLAALTGVTRLAAAPTKTFLQIAGTIGTVVGPGFQARDASNPSVVFTTRETVTLVDDGFGIGRAEVYGYANVNGPQAANPETVEQVVTPVFGVGGVSNGDDPVTTVLGRFAETDEELRIRRRSLLFSSGNATVNAIRDAVLRVPDVESVSVFENDTGATVDGIPEHSFETLVIGGQSQAIVDAIGANKPAGIAAFGNENLGLFYTDSQGFTHNVDFTRPSDVPIEVHVTLETNDDFPVDGIAQVKQAFVDYIDGLGLGDDVKRNLLFGAIDEIPGITDVTALTIGPVGGPYLTSNIVVALRSQASLTTAHVTVTV